MKYIITTTCGEEEWKDDYVESRKFEYTHKEKCDLPGCKVTIQESK